MKEAAGEKWREMFSPCVFLQRWPATHSRTFCSLRRPRSVPYVAGMGSGASDTVLGHAKLKEALGCAAGDDETSGTPQIALVCVGGGGGWGGAVWETRLEMLLVLSPLCHIYMD
jgi:hypothetical protein